MKLLALLLVVYSAIAQFVPPLAPESIRQDVPVVYFGPPPSSTIQEGFIGPLQLLNSTISIDTRLGTVTLPLYRGSISSNSSTQVNQTNDFWYIITDSSDLETARMLGLHYSPKLAFIGPDALRKATGDISGGSVDLVFQSGIVDFGLNRDIIPGVAPNYWPLSNDTNPGSEGDIDYTPLVLLANRIVLDAPIVAGTGLSEEELNNFCEGISNDSNAKSNVHDRVVAICPRDNTVTLKMSLAFSFGRPFWYLGMDASDRNLAALEMATWAPKLRMVNTDCWRESTCPTQIAMGVVNGPTDANFTGHSASGSENVSFSGHHPFRQGLNSAAHGEGDALWVVGEIPSLGIHTTPLWDIYEIEWTEDAMRAGIVTRLKDIFEAFGLNIQEWMNAFRGTSFMSSGEVLNAPSVWRFY
jgi:hypothetical protein